MHSLNVIPAFSIFCYGAAAGISACLVSLLGDKTIRKRRNRK